MPDFRQRNNDQVGKHGRLRNVDSTNDNKRSSWEIDSDNIPKRRVNQFGSDSFADGSDGRSHSVSSDGLQTRFDQNPRNQQRMRQKQAQDAQNKVSQQGVGQHGAAQKESSQQARHGEAQSTSVNRGQKSSARIAGVQGSSVWGIDASRQDSTQSRARDYYTSTPSGFTSREDELKRLRSKKRRKRKGPIIAVVIVLLVVVGASALYLVNSARDLKSGASTAMNDINLIQDSFQKNDYNAAAAASESLQKTASGMNRELSSPVWTVASWIPVVGGDIGGVKTIASVLDDASTNALVPLTEALKETPPANIIRSDGSIDVSAASTLLDSVQDAAPVMQRCTDQLVDLPEMSIAELQTVIEPAKEKISTVNSMFQQAGAFAPILGSFLGVDGPRNYVIAAQNTAEIRASGGFPGSVGLLTISNGSLELGDFGRPYDLMTDTLPAGMTATQEELALFGDYVTVPRDSGFNADFTRVGEIWAGAYAEKTGTHVDGVFAITPAVVQDILKITGPITLSDGTKLTGDNATKVLQHDLYWKYFSADNVQADSGELLDNLFAEAAHLAFDSLIDHLNTGTFMQLAGVFAQAMDDREIMIYLTNENEQAVIEEAGLGGDIVGTAEKPELGVFYDLWISSKMGWYTDIETEVSEGKKLSDGATQYQVTTTLHNALSNDEAEEAGLIAGSLLGSQYGDMQPQVYFYAPVGGSISDFKSSAGSAAELTYEGTQVYFLQRPTLAPGDTVTVTYTVTTSPEAQSDLKVLQTPTLTEYR